MWNVIWIVSDKKEWLLVEDSTNVPLTDFYISCETQAFSFISHFSIIISSIDHSHISITDLLNSNFTALSLHSLTEVSLDFVEESLSVLSNILYLLPPSVQSLSLHRTISIYSLWDLSFVETSEENVPTEEQPGKIPRKITHLTLSSLVVQKSSCCRCKQYQIVTSVFIPTSSLSICIGY